ncbi:CHC2 zinc finger domain-containing protein [Desulfurobacterium sp. TC5-1]|uniref:CHC2 zinc finger domain-containing protein n=1 Tax=Desulfurobacterium sp. TC5-1 TaxID=1158318 RepID=UPI0003B69393|nr:CHC2 zinc finger domain-containing protein [Desulfurobacterium sp. TC5-1]
MDKLFRLKEKLEEQFPTWDFKWKVSGTNRLLGLCPFHREKHHSFNIYIYGNNAYYRCFSCGAKGSLTAEKNKASPALSLMKIFRKELFKSKALEYFTYRGISRKILEELKFIGVIPKGFTDKRFPVLSKSEGWIVFLYTDIHGNPASFHLRKPFEKKIRVQKISEGFSGMGLDEAFKSDEPFIFFVEGEFDALVPMSREKRYLPIVSVGGTSGFFQLDSVAENLKNLGKTVIIFPDNDEAGIVAVTRMKSNVHIATGIEKKDLGEECLSRSFKEVLENLSIKPIGEIKKEVSFKKIREILNMNIPDGLKKALMDNSYSFLKKIKTTKEKRVIVCRDGFNPVKRRIEKANGKKLLIGEGEIEGADYFDGVPDVEEVRKLFYIYDVIIFNPGYLLEADEKKLLRAAYSVVPEGKRLILIA